MMWIILRHEVQFDCIGFILEIAGTLGLNTARRKICVISTQVRRQLLLSRAPVIDTAVEFFIPDTEGGATVSEANRDGTSLGHVLGEKLVQKELSGEWTSQVVVIEVGETRYSTEEGSSFPIGAVIGAVVGILAIAGIIVAVVIVKKRKDRFFSNSSSQPLYGSSSVSSSAGLPPFQPVASPDAAYESATSAFVVPQHQSMFDTDVQFEDEQLYTENEEENLAYSHSTTMVVPESGMIFNSDF